MLLVSPSTRVARVRLRVVVAPSGDNRLLTRGFIPEKPQVAVQGSVEGWFFRRISPAVRPTPTSVHGSLAAADEVTVVLVGLKSPCA